MPKPAAPAEKPNGEPPPSSNGARAIRVERLKQGWPTPRIQCQHLVNSDELYGHADWRQKRYKHGEWQKCQHSSRWRVNGVPMCTRHAGPLALEALCETTPPAPLHENSSSDS